MKKSKKTFLVMAVLFFAVMGYIGYDISSRTTFPGSKPQLKERLMKDSDPKADTLAADSLNNDLK